MEVSSTTGERLGPLLVSRHRKPDGRALILYARVDAYADARADDAGRTTPDVSRTRPPPASAPTREQP